MKTCTSCKQTKAIDAFSRDKRRGHAARCKECRKAEVTAWRRKNRDYQNAKDRKRYAENPSRRNSHLRRKYGISADDYAARLLAQGGCCAICRVSAESLGETMAVDHDHATGDIRGLLCAKCNRMLGCANDKPDVLLAGAAYLNAEAARQFILAYADARGLMLAAEAMAA